MADGIKNFSPASSDLGLGELLADQLKIKSEEARQAALKKTGASAAQVSMSASTQSLYGFLNGNSLDDLFK